MHSMVRRVFSKLDNLDPALDNESVEAQGIAVCFRRINSATDKLVHQPLRHTGFLPHKSSSEYSLIFWTLTICSTPTPSDFPFLVF